MPTRGGALEVARRAEWREFARRLPRGARVLDLATGDGRVPRDLLATRRDLKPLGIDLAPQLPPPPRGVKLCAGVAMEELPFPDGSFEGATSQFGIEYGEVGVIARELARVLVTGAQIGLMMHHPAGPILAHNRNRRLGLRWVLEEARLIDKARAGMLLRAAGLPSPPAITAAPAAAVKRFGTGSAGWELAEAIRRTLAMVRPGTGPALEATLSELESRAMGEIGRIDALERAALASSDIAALGAVFLKAGLSGVAPCALTDRDTGLPFARMWQLTRS